MSRVAYVVAYDIADDERREDVAMFLSGTARASSSRSSRWNYPTCQRVIYGARRIEERMDFWIV